MIENQRQAASKLIVNDQWVKLGRVGKPHGLGGAFFVSGRQEPFPSSVKTIRVGLSPEDSQLLTPSKQRLQGDRPVLLCKEICGRNEVDSLKNQSIWCLRSELSIDEEREYLWADLIGKEVVDCAGQSLGRVQLVDNYGASDFVQIVHQSRGKLAIPFVGTYFEMSFEKQGRLTLKVSIETFDEVWESE